MTLRARLLIVTICGLALTMGLWGWLELKLLDNVIVSQHEKRLTEIAETVSTYYQHFPSRRGLAALDVTLKDQVQGDPRLARIDLFTMHRGNVEFVAGAGRIAYDWPEAKVADVIRMMRPETFQLETENGPAMGVLVPWASEEQQSVHAVGIIGFSQLRYEVIKKARIFLIFSSFGFLVVLLVFIVVAFDRMIGRPLEKIVNTIDRFQAGEYRDRINVTRRDELGVVAEHFNAMADEIERAMAKNEELTAHLQLRVQEETAKVVQLQNQVSQLQKLSAMGYLMATLAHDLGTPIHSMAGMAELLLERGPWPPDVARKLELIVQQARRLHLAIQNMKRMTRPPEAHFEMVSCGELMEENLPLLESLLKRLPITLSVNVADNLPRLFVDRNRFQTALLNLVQNSAEAIGEKGGEIQIAVSFASDRNAVSVSVKDDGPGIPEEIKDRVCEPFFSTHETEGLRGLGLAIVQDIMKTHGGGMEIRSSERRGTEVSLYFPVTRT
ncbi:MAG TPA: HAMP domain-containing sensor histidine kinase [Syntrophales bacterium]|nr:HAMP domain-containing sensor histidine kinase [Syntrophales bacterium]HOL58997.1 HAMP domain-containing sensor histidine kinase [Syntrophales bacterium]HPO34725.1 HAMP domain-containing sensor histidine kinase [Syntrophales bacterium]